MKLLISCGYFTSYFNSYTSILDVCSCFIRAVVLLLLELPLLYCVQGCSLLLFEVSRLIVVLMQRFNHCMEYVCQASLVFLAILHSIFEPFTHSLFCVVFGK